MKKIGIIGCGNMGTILVDSAVSLVDADDVFCFDVEAEKLKLISKKYKVKCLNSNKELVENVDIIILAVKPQQFKEVLTEIKDVLKRDKVVVSIAAGIKIKYIEKFLPKGTQIIRCMPNLPLKVGCGVVAICKNKKCSRKNYDFVKKIFLKKGIVVEIEEKYIDLITAISGSGPAYIFLISEIMQRVALKLGMPKKIIPKVVNYTILGAARMLTEENKTAEELRIAVTSKGGTTEQALKVFFENNLNEIFYQAIKKAYTRAKELSKY